MKRLDNSVVAINTDAAEMQNTCCREVHIEGVPNVTHEIAKVPLIRERYDSVERHHTQSDQEIGESQTDHEIVGDDSQFPMFDDADDHEKVAQDSSDDNEAHDHAFDDEGKDVDVNGAFGCEGGVGDVSNGANVCVVKVRIVEAVVQQGCTRHYFGNWVLGAF